jgi:hypothetical protein
MYADPDSVDPNTLFQGDIITDFPFFLLEKGLSMKKTSTGYSKSDNVEVDGSGNSLFAVESKKQTVMILSQTCDLQRRSNAIICPVYDLQTFVSDQTLNTGRLQSIRDRKIYYWFYLPQFQSLSESIADLQTMIYVPRTEIQKYLPKRTTTLSDLGRHHLGWSLANYFGRPAE